MTRESIRYRMLYLDDQTREQNRAAAVQRVHDRAAEADHAKVQRIMRALIDSAGPSDVWAQFGDR